MINANTGNLEVLQRSRGLDAVVGFSRDYLFSQQILFDSDLFLRLRWNSEENAANAGKNGHSFHNAS